MATVILIAGAITIAAYYLDEHYQQMEERKHFPRE